jgi:large subunit ribosomal protein L31
MKVNIHPKWFPQANVVCACGNTWKTGATQAELRTDICSACHPFYTGEQRIVDTEGQVDRFYKKLQVRDAKRASAAPAAVAVAAGPNPQMTVAELGLQKRYVALMNENGINTVADVLAKLQNGDDDLLAINGIGRQVVAETKKTIRQRGFTLPGE